MGIWYLHCHFQSEPLPLQAAANFIIPLSHFDLFPEVWVGMEYNFKNYLSSSQGTVSEFMIAFHHCIKHKEVPLCVSFG